MKRFNLRRRPKSTSAVYALGLALGSMGAGIAVPQAAFAQEGPELSREFRGAIGPVQTALNAQRAEAGFEAASAEQKAAMLSDELASLMAARGTISTPDDRLYWGQFVYGIGADSGDVALQRQGLGAMVESGQLTGERLAQVATAAGQLAYNADDYAAARTYLQQAVDTGLANQAVSGLIAESYWAEENAEAGFAAIDAAIERSTAASQTVPENWYQRALAIAFRGELMDPTRRYSLALIDAYPTDSNWKDVLVIERQFGNYERAELLDLLRLMSRANALRERIDFYEYFETAGTGRLPGEVNSMIDAGIAAGALTESEVAEIREEVVGRIDEDRASLPTLSAEARAAGATPGFIINTGDAFLSYGMAAEAEEMFRLALERPGVDTELAMTRLGIALADQGRHDEAAEVFAQVEGVRAQIAKLWETYARQQGGM